MFGAEELDFEPNASLSYVPWIVFFVLNKNLNLNVCINFTSRQVSLNLWGHSSTGKSLHNERI